MAGWVQAFLLEVSNVLILRPIGKSLRRQLFLLLLLPRVHVGSSLVLLWICLGTCWSEIHDEVVDAATSSQCAWTAESQEGNRRPIFS